MPGQPLPVAVWISQAAVPSQNKNTEEVICPLLNNWFLAFITDVQTAPIQCQNGTQSEVYLSQGINKFFISHGCKCILEDHIIKSNLNVKSDLDIIHYNWSWNCISLESFELEDLTPHLFCMEKAGLTWLTLQDLQTHKMESACEPSGLAYYFYMAGLVLLVLSLLATTTTSSTILRTLQPQLPVLLEVIMPQWKPLPLLTFPISNLLSTIWNNDSAFISCNIFNPIHIKFCVFQFSL